MAIIQGNSQTAAGGFNTGLIQDSVWLDGAADYFDGPSFPAQANPTCFTFATWVLINKFSIASLGQYLWSAERSGNYASISFNAANKLVAYSNPALFTSDMVFRDVGWYHIICSFKGPDNTVEMFVNGVRINNTTSSTLASNLEPVHAAHTHRIGAYYVGATGSTLFPANSYLSQTVFLDGQSTQDSTVSVTDFLDTFEFGTNGSQFGPKSNADITALAANSFGTNSYALDFSDSANLGYDSRPHNLITYSQDINQWTDSSGTDVVVNSLVAPDGSQTADQIQRSASASSVWTGRTSAIGVVETSTVYTVSGYFKQDTPGANYPLINFINPASYENRAQVHMRFSSGTLTLAHWGGTAKVGNPVFTDSGNGWWRVSFQVLTSSTATSYYVSVMPNGGQTGTDPVGVWGIQVEQGTLGTYVPTPKNVLFYTQQFDNGYWTKVNGAAITADQAVAPDGTTTADLATAGNALYGSLFARRYLTSTEVIPSTQYTLSCYVKKGNYRYIQLRQPNSRVATFDFDTKTFVGVTSDIESTGYDDVGNDWYRIHSTYTQASSITNYIVDIAFATSAGGSSFTPAGTETVYIWGAQYETGGLSTYRPISSTAAVNVVPNNFTPTNMLAANQSTNTPSLEFATLNPLNGDATLVAALEYGNRLGVGNSDWDSVFATKSMGRTGKYYYEVRVHTNTSSNGFPAGIHEESTTSKNWANYIGNTTATYGLGYGLYSAGDSNSYYTNGSGANLSDYSGALVAGDIVMMAVDLDNSKIWWGKNGTFFNGTPSSNTNGVSIQADTDYVFGMSPSASEDYFVNFGADSTFGGAISAGGNSDSKGVGDFKYTVPTGFIALASASMDTPTLQGVDNFSVTLGTESAVAPTENLFKNSEDLSTTWTGAGTETLNAAPNPIDGVISADLAIRSATNGKFEQGFFSGLIAGQRYIHSMYIKNVSVSTGQTSMHCWGVTGGYAGRLLISWSGATPSLHSISYSAADPIFENLGDGWYRISYSLVLNNSGTHYNGFEISTAGTGESAYVWGSQLELSNSSSNKIDDSGSTVTGNMTNGGGLNAIFDLDTTKNNAQAASGANTNSNDSFVVVDHGSAKTIEQFVAYASTDAQGFDGDSGASTITFTLAGSTDNFSSSNVALFTGTVADGAGAVHTVSTGITRGAYRYHKMTVQTQTLNANEKFGRLAQLEFYEGATAPSTYVPTYTSGFASLPSTHKLGLIDNTTTENYIRNNTMEGAVAGTPGTAPTGWVIIGNGATVQLVGYGVTDDGIEYVDYKFSGTPTEDPWMYFQDGTSIPALAGEEWTYSAYVALVAGSLTNLASAAEIALQIIGRNSAGSYVSFGGQRSLTPTSALVRHAFTGTLAGATVTRVSNKIIINWDGSGAIDATFRIGNPQMEKRSHASPVIKTNQYTMNHNLALQSQTMDNATWVKSSCAVSTNVAVAPDGSQTAEGIQALNSSSSEKRVQQGIASVPAGTYLTASFYVKAARLSFAAVTIYDSISRVVRKFVNLSNGAIGSDSGGNNPQEPTFNVESVNNGWYRISAGQRTVGSGTVTMRVQPAASDGNLAYVASESNVDEIYVWGAQLEKTFNSPRTYLPTTTDAVFEPTQRTSLNSFVEIQKNRDAAETWAWRFSHDYDKEYAFPNSGANTAAAYQDIRDQTGTNNWVSYALKIAAASGTAAGSIAHGFATGATTVTHSLASNRYIVLLFNRSGGDIFYYHPDVASGSLLKFNSSVLPFSSTVITNITSNSFDIGSSTAQGVYDYLVIAETPGVTDIFSYTGNNTGSNTNGAYISLNAMPEFWTAKLITTHATEHVVLDQTRSPINDSDIPYLLPNQNVAESNNTAFAADFLSGAVKIRNSSTDLNFNGGTLVGWSFGKISGGGDLPPIYGR